MPPLGEERTVLPSHPVAQHPITHPTLQPGWNPPAPNAFLRDGSDGGHVVEVDEHSEGYIPRKPIFVPYGASIEQPHPTVLSSNDKPARSLEILLAAGLIRKGV